MASEEGRNGSLAEESQAWPVATARRAAVVLNGNAKGVTPRLIDMLEGIVHEQDLFVSRSLKQGYEISRTIVERRYDTVFTGGGDGTFVQMVSWIAQITPPQTDLPRFGFLKLGTGNALAWIAGSQDQKPRDIPADLRRALGGAGDLSLRLIEAGGLLTPFAGLGADAIALDHYHQVGRFMRRTALLRPLASSPFAYAAAIVGRTMPEFALAAPLRVTVVNRGEPAQRIGADGEPQGEPVQKGEAIYQGSVRMVAFSTIPYWGFGARIFPDAETRNDRFSLRIADFGGSVVLANVRSIWRGTFRHPKLQDFLVDAISIECESATPFQAGGDLLGRRSEIAARLSDRTVRLVDFAERAPTR